MSLKTAKNKRIEIPLEGKSRGKICDLFRGLTEERNTRKVKTTKREKKGNTETKQAKKKDINTFKRRDFNRILSVRVVNQICKSEKITEKNSLLFMSFQN